MYETVVAGFHKSVTGREAVQHATALAAADALAESVRAARGSTTSGTLTPLLFEISPPTATVQSAPSGLQAATVSRILPSLTSRLAPGWSEWGTRAQPDDRRTKY